MSAQDNPPKNVQETEEQVLNKRLERIGWALFLIMIAGIALVPDERIPEGPFRGLLAYSLKLVVRHRLIPLS